MATAAQTRFVATASASGAAVGLLLVAVRSGHAAACSVAGTCAPGALLTVKPYVAAALIGLLLGALIAIAAVLAWRAIADVRAGTPAPRARSHGRGLPVATRARH